MSAAGTRPCSAARLLLCMAAACVGPALMLWLMRHGVNYQDEPYQMLNALEWRETPLAPLSAALGHAWASAFGFTLLSMRSLAAACSLLSAAAASLYLYARARRACAALLTFGCASALMALCPWMSYLYGWDSLSMLALTLTAIAMLAYLRRPSALLAAVAGGAVALAAFARVPNVVALLPCLLIVALPAGRRMARVTAALAAALAVALCLICAMYGTPAAYAATLRDNIISGHTLPQLIGGYAIGADTCLRVGALAAAMIPACLLIRRAVPCPAASLLALAAGAALGLMVPGYMEWPGIIAHACAMVSLVASLAAMGGHFREAAAIAAIALTASAGSDMGLTKLLCAPLLPLALAYISSERLRVSVMVLAAVATMSAVAELRLQSSAAFEDRGYRHTTVKLTSTPLAGVYTTPERAEEILALDSIIRQTAAHGGRVVAAGDCYRYVVDLLARRPRPVAMRHAYLIYYPAYIPALRSVIAEAPPQSVVVATVPFDWREALPPGHPAAAELDTAASRALPLGPEIYRTPKFTVRAIAAEKSAEKKSDGKFGGLKKN